MLTLSLAAICAARAAGAAEVTRVVSAFDDDNKFDLHLTVSWLHEAKTASIKRESQGDASPKTTLENDLKFLQTVNVLNLRAAFGVFWDVGLHIDAPIVISDDRALGTDSGSGTTLQRDGILPTGGIDAQHPGRPFTATSDVFRGPTRRGLEYLGLGITWAPFNQARDDTKPTWTLGFDARLDVSKDMTFDPANPGANSAVGLGYHQLLWSTNVSRRFRYFEPYFGAWYMLPVRSKGSPFVRYPTGGQTSVDPQQEAGVQVGVEHIAWENRRAAQRVTVEFRGRMQEHFFGRSHSELWEALSGSPACATDTTQCRRDPNAGGANVGIDFDAGRASPYPGVTETEAYASFGGDAGVNIQVGKHVRFRGLFGLTVDQPHFITFANAGRDLPGPSGAPPDGVVDLNNPDEKSPAYREVIDHPGRRFKVEGTEIWSLFLEGSIMF